MSDVKIERLYAGDRDSLADLLDEVFTAQNGCAMDFRKIHPRVLRDIDENMGWYRAIRENGEIVGAAGCHPFPYRVLDTTLKVAQIGNVAVSSKCRNRGFMQKLMGSLCEVMVNDGYDMAYLHGERKRYRTFGFERCGVEYVLTMTTSLPKALGLKSDFTFVDMRDNFDAYKDEVIAMSRGAIHEFVRGEDEIYLSLTAHDAMPLIIKKPDGTTAGYLCYAARTNMVIELVLLDHTDLVDTVVALFGYLGIDSFVLDISEYESDILGEAMKICRHCQTIQSGNFKIFNFKKVVETFMNAKATYAPLMDGALVVDTELFGKWSITCTSGKCKVEKTDAPADVYVDGYKVYPFFFGPMTPFGVGVDMKNVGPEAKLLIANWLPLPLYCLNCS